MTEDQNKLIEEGKEILKQGLGGAFLLKWIRERVEDSAESHRLVELIHGRDPDAPKKPKEEILRERALRNARYKVENYHESIAKLKIIPFWLVVGCIPFGISAFLSGHSGLYHVLVSSLSAIVIYLTLKNLNWNRKATPQLLFGVAISVIIMEFLLLGFPTRIIPGFGETATHKWINVLTLLNDFTPVIYYILKGVLTFFVAQVYLNYLEVESISSLHKQQLKVRF